MQSSANDMSTVQAQCMAMMEPRPVEPVTAAELARRISARGYCEEGIPKGAVLVKRTKRLTPMAFDETAGSPGAMSLLIDSSDDGTLSDVSRFTVQSYEIRGPTRPNAISQDTGPTAKAGDSSLCVGANTYCLPPYSDHSTAFDP